jgi:predicted PurR-regulated permease PerM
MILSGIYLGVGAACLIAIFVILFFLSLFSRGRGIADKLFGLPEYTELEQLKNEITRELSGITRANTRMNTRLDNVEATVNDVSKKIAAIIKTSGGASHATALSTTKAKTKKEGKKKSGRT